MRVTQLRVYSEPSLALTDTLADIYERETRYWMALGDVRWIPIPYGIGVQLVWGERVLTTVYLVYGPNKIEVVIERASAP